MPHHRHNFGEVAQRRLGRRSHNLQWIIIITHYKERSHSGLVRTLGKRVDLKGSRGFESLPLRHVVRERRGTAIKSQAILSFFASYLVLEIYIDQ